MHITSLLLEQHFLSDFRLLHCSFLQNSLGKPCKYGKFDILPDDEMLLTQFSFVATQNERNKIKVVHNFQEKQAAKIQHMLT